MCIFCAAIPASMAIGANLNAKQKTKRQAAEKEGALPPTAKPIAQITVGVVLLLTAGSVVYHTVISPI